VADDAGLLAELLDHLEVAEFTSVGWSGGGPHALAAAALLAGRCRAATVIAGVGPYGVEGLDFLDGMGEDNIHEFGAALAGEAQLRQFLHTAAEGLRATTGSDIIEALASLLPASDRAVLTGEAADEMAAEMHEAISQGIEGWVDDDLAFTRSWGFDLGTITTPVALWQGSDDLMVPLAHGRWLAQAVSGACARELPGEGHLSLVSGRMGELFDELGVMAGW
jgi:pimeloyl-ACP methyl ester carboxylesterase